MTEANQNFPRVVRMVDERGPVVVLRNNRPSYVIIEYDAARDFEVAADEGEVQEVSQRIMAEYAQEYRELAQ